MRAVKLGKLHVCEGRCNSVRTQSVDEDRAHLEIHCLITAYWLSSSISTTFSPFPCPPKFSDVFLGTGQSSSMAEGTKLVEHVGLAGMHL